MTMTKLRGLGQANEWRKHLADSYTKCRGEHTSSWGSWAKTRFRSGNGMDTAIGSLDKAGSAAGLVTGALALPGAATAATMAGLSVAAASTLYALPAAITIGAVAYWGYNKNEHNKVNQEIWTYWKDKHGNRADKNTFIERDMKLLVRWLCWFGDEGISNMNHLGEKNKEAKDAFDKKFKSIDNERDTLRRQIDEANRVGAANDDARKKKAEKAKTLQRQSDELATKYINLGQDLQYIIYRVERFMMYHEMLDLTVRSLKEVSDLPKLQRDANAAFAQQTASYEYLLTTMSNLPVPT